MLGEGPIYDVNGGFGAAEKKFSINFTKANIKFCLSLYYYNQIYITIMRSLHYYNEIYKRSTSLKMVIKMSTF